MGGGVAGSHAEKLLLSADIGAGTEEGAELLTECRRTNENMAIGVDEYGATQGIVTLEDLIEEIVGEIEDEFDLPDESVERIDDHTIRV